MKMYDIRLFNFFDCRDENNVLHNGFLQSIDLSSYVDLTILNEITLNLMDSFIKNEIGKMITLGNWNCFLNWDETTKKFKINSEFYDSAKYSIYVYLCRSQRFFELLNTNFSSLSATETESVVYGQKETNNDYDRVVVSIERENDTTQYGNTRKDFSFGNTRKDFSFGNTRKDFSFGEKETETEFGNTRKDFSFGEKETETEFGNTRKDFSFGEKETETEFGNTRKDNTIGQQTNSSGTTNQTHPFDLNTFLDDTNSETSITNGTRQDTETTVTHTDTETIKAHTDTETTTAHTDTETIKAHTDTETTTAHTDTETIKAHTDTETTTAHTDTETIKARTDTETTTAHTDTETENAHADTETENAHTDTNTYGDITNTTNARKDKTLIKTHTDTKTRTKTILISPDKYFEIMKELYSYNVYDILLQAIRDCFTIRAF